MKGHDASSPKSGRFSRFNGSSCCTSCTAPQSEPHRPRRYQPPHNVHLRKFSLS